MLPLMIAAALMAPTPTAPPAPADGTYTYVSSMDGDPIGKTAITVARDGTTIVLREQGSASVDGTQGTVSDTLTLGASQLAPAAYNASTSIAGQPYTIAIAFNGADAVQTGYQQQTYDLVPSAKHFVVLDMGSFSGWFVLPAQMQAWNDATAVAIVPAMGSGLTITPSSALDPVRPKSVPLADAAISVSSPVAFTVWYDPKSLLVDYVDLPSQGIIVSRDR